jgi:hypothetical protein
LGACADDDDGQLWVFRQLAAQVLVDHGVPAGVADIGRREGLEFFPYLASRVVHESLCEGVAAERHAAGGVGRPHAEGVVRRARDWVAHAAASYPRQARFRLGPIGG